MHNLKQFIPFQKTEKGDFKTIQEAVNAVEDKWIPKQRLLSEREFTEKK
jgi:hypothetical protein